MALAESAIDSANKIQERQANIYERGIEHALRANADNLSEPGHRRFTKIQKAYIMGLCRVRRWKKVPKIWKEIEKTKNNEDLRVVLEEHWAKHKVQRGATILYSIFWEDDFIGAIRTTRLSRAKIVRFATSMAGIGMLNLMPWSQEDIDSYYRDREAKAKTAATRTEADEKEAWKNARLPPTRYEAAMVLFTT